MRKHIYYSATILIVLSIFNLGCIKVPDNLIAPQWNIELNIPIVQKSYTLSDIIKNQNYIHTESFSTNDNIYVLQSDTYSETIGISKFIHVTKQASSLNNHISATPADSTILYLDFPEGAQLDSAKFIQGYFAYYIQNPSANDVNVEFSVPGIKLPNGSVFRVNKVIHAMQSDTAKISFADAEYKIPPNQQQLPNFLKYTLEIVVKARASVLTGSYVLANFYNSNFYFESVSGYLPAKNLGTKTEGFKLLLGNADSFRGKTQLKDADLQLNATYLSPVAKPFNIEVKNLNLVGKRNDGTKFLLTDNTGNPDISFIFDNGQYQKTFTQKNSNITDFIAFLPDSIILNAEYIMNPDSNKGTATIQDSINFSTNFSTKSILSLQNSSLTDTAEISFNDNVRQNIQKGRSANISVEITNGTPLTTWLKLTFTDSNYVPLFTLKNESNLSDSIMVAGAEINSSGEVTNPVASKSTILLDSTEVNKLANSAHVIYSITVRTKDANTNSPPTVAIRPDDKISIKAYGGVKLKLDPSNNN